MNSIFKYLKSKLHVLLFLFLEILCVISIYKFNSHQSAFYYSHTRKLSSKFHEVNSSIFDYFGLFNQNQALFNENIELRRKLKSNYVAESKGTFEVNDTVFKQRYKYLPAQVITNSTNRQNNLLTINRGSSSGIEKGLGVFCSEGVVGIIVEVSDNYSIATSILNTNQFVIVPKILELNYQKGKIVWDGKDPNFLFLEEINKYEPLKKDYHLVTSSYSKFFPENIPIGTIESVEAKNSETFFDVKVKTAVNYGKIKTVYIVFDLFREEIKELEKSQSNLNASAK
ncbi:MAG: rod shape-determining protein MreC [Bacteroidia bacterium]